MDTMLQRILDLVGNKHGSTKELADAIGISGNSITNWKNGHSTSYTKYAPQIAEYYGVSLDWLSGNSDVKEKLVTNKDDERSIISKEIMGYVKQLSPEQQRMVLVQIKALSQTQE